MTVRGLGAVCVMPSEVEASPGEARSARRRRGSLDCARDDNDLIHPAVFSYSVAPPTRRRMTRRMTPAGRRRHTKASDNPASTDDQPVDEQENDCADDRPDPPRALFLMTEQRRCEEAA